nr:unknown Function [uncultured bacterium]
MKKIYLLALICSFSVCTFAQLDKGKILLGGTIGAEYNRKKIESYNDKSSYFIISPEAGKFYKNNRLIGVGFSVGINKPDSSYHVNNYGVKTYLRQYFPLGKSFFFFAEEGLKFSYYRYILGSDIIIQHNTSVYLKPGLTFEVNPRFQVEVALSPLATLAYDHSRTKVSNTNSGRLNSTSNGVSLYTNTDRSFLGDLAIGLRWVLK